MQGKDAVRMILDDEFPSKRARSRSPAGVSSAGSDVMDMSPISPSTAEHDTRELLRSLEGERIHPDLPPHSPEQGIADEGPPSPPRDDPVPPPAAPVQEPVVHAPPPRPERKRPAEEEEDQEEEDQEEGRPYAGPTTPALESRGRRLRPDRGTRRTPVRPVAFRRAVAFRGRAFQGTTSPVV